MCPRRARVTTRKSKRRIKSSCDCQCAKKPWCRRLSKDTAMVHVCLANASNLLILTPSQTTATDFASSTQSFVACGKFAGCTKKKLDLPRYRGGILEVGGLLQYHRLRQKDIVSSNWFKTFQSSCAESAPAFFPSKHVSRFFGRPLPLVSGSTLQLRNLPPKTAWQQSISTIPQCPEWSFTAKAKSPLFSSSFSSTHPGT